MPDGSLGPSLDLTDEEVQSPELATDAAGRTIAVWVRDDLIEGARILPPPSPPAPQGPSPSAAAVVTTCPPVTVTSLRSHRPRGKRKGIGAKLRLDRDARLRLVSAKLRYGKRRSATLPVPRIGFGDEATLRFKLPRRLARKLAVGRRVTLELKLRTAAAGCAFGVTQTVRLRTSVRRPGAS